MDINLAGDALKRTKDFLKGVGATDPKCSFCGETPTAYWSGHDHVFVCHDCSIDILPRLIADALYIPRMYSAAMAEREFEKVATQFYRGVACRLAAKLRERT